MVFLMRVYINLTAGLEGYKFFKHLNPVFIRIPSSYIESKAWDKLFYTLDSDLLLHLALGEECVIVDASKNPAGSKVIRIGIPMIKYVLGRIWLEKEFVDKFLGKDYQERVYKELSRDTRERLKYFKNFLDTEEIRLYGISIHIRREKTYEEYREMALKLLKDSK